MPDDDKTKRAAEIGAAIKKADDDKKRQDDDKKRDGETLDKLLDALSGLTQGMRSFQSRLDALESKHLEGHGGPRQRNLVTGDGGSPPRSPLSNGPADDSAAVVRSPISTGDDHGKTHEFGEPRSTAADSADPNDAIFGRGRKFQGDFYQRQADADMACRAWGAAAVPPLHGEQLLDYRKRLLRPLIKYSTQFKDVSLDELREPLLTPIEKSIFADAIKASTDNSSAPDDYLREVTTTDQTGRRVTSFYGQPRAWMNQFAGQRRRLVGIRTTSSP
jgi:hypothetical protein